MITSRSDCSAVSTSPEEMPPPVAVRVQWDSALLSSHEGSWGLPVPDFREAESAGGTRCSRRLPCGPGLQVPHHKRVSTLEDSLKDKCCTRKCPVVTGQPLCLTFIPYCSQGRLMILVFKAAAQIHARHIGDPLAAWAPACGRQRQCGSLLFSCGSRCSARSCPPHSLWCFSAGSPLPPAVTPLLSAQGLQHSH